MEWKQIGILKEVCLTISNIDTDSIPWAVRGYNCVYAVDPKTYETLWAAKLEGDLSFGDRSLVVANDHVIVSAHRNEDRGNVWLSAFELKTGQLAWERKVGWTLS